MSTSGVTLIPETIPSSSALVATRPSALLLARPPVLVLGLSAFWRAAGCSSRRPSRRAVSFFASRPWRGRRPPSSPASARGWGCSTSAQRLALEVREQDARERVGVGEGALIIRWKKLLNATAGMATKRPTAVATSASAMLDMTVCGARAWLPPGRPGSCRLAEGGEGADDADDRAEEADERRVVAERAQVREPPLELHPRERHRAGHRLLGGAGPAVGHREAGGRRPRPRRAGEAAHALLGRLDRVVERGAQLLGEDGEVVPERPEVPGPLQDDRDRDDAERDEEQHDPPRAEADHDALQPLGQCSSLSGSFRGPRGRATGRLRIRPPRRPQQSRGSDVPGFPLGRAASRRRRGTPVRARWSRSHPSVAQIGLRD